MNLRALLSHSWPTARPIVILVSGLRNNYHQRWTNYIWCITGNTGLKTDLANVGILLALSEILKDSKEKDSVVTSILSIV